MRGIMLELIFKDKLNWFKLFRVVSTVKEVPIQIKQEPVERDLQTEPEKTKMRYKKGAPQPPVSVVSLLLLPQFASSLFLCFF